jgi:endonuclease/exonuclease/phosphatase family metal-dependent hydrolase
MNKPSFDDVYKFIVDNLVSVDKKLPKDIPNDDKNAKYNGHDISSLCRMTVLTTAYYVYEAYYLKINYDLSKMSSHIWSILSLIDYPTPEILNFTGLPFDKKYSATQAKNIFRLFVLMVISVIDKFINTTWYQSIKILLKADPLGLPNGDIGHIPGAAQIKLLSKCVIGDVKDLNLIHDVFAIGDGNTPLSVINVIDGLVNSYYKNYPKEIKKHNDQKINVIKSFIVAPKAQPAAPTVQSPAPKAQSPAPKAQPVAPKAQPVQPLAPGPPVIQQPPIQAKFLKMYMDLYQEITNIKNQIKILSTTRDRKNTPNNLYLALEQRKLALALLNKTLNSIQTGGVDHSLINDYIKYMKYKTKYMQLKNPNMVGGVLGVKPSVVKVNPKLGITNVFVHNVDLANPYIDIVDKSTKKAELLSVKRKMAEIQPFASPFAYNGEHPNMTPGYCGRLPIYKKPAPGNIRVMTYNVHNWVKQCPTPVPGIVNSVGRNILFAMSVVDQMFSDIVCMQEIVPVYTKEPKTPKEIEEGSFYPIINEMARKGYNNYYISDTHYVTDLQFDPLDSGREYFVLCNAIFSKNPIIYNVTGELGNNRIAMLTVIDIPTGILILINIHIEFNWGEYDNINGVGFETDLAKQVQIDKLAVFIRDQSIIIDGIIGQIEKETNTKIKKLYLLIGDFNNDKSALDFKSLNEIGLTLLNAKYSVAPTDHEPLFSGQNQRELIDMAHTNDVTKINEQSLIIVPNDSSDHYPSYVDILPL